MRMNAGEYILTRGLPKTGEIITEPEGCDGFYQAGWWVGEKINGHKQRFIAKTIGGDDVVIDLATGLMWAANAAVKGCAYNATLTWVLAIQYGNDLDFAGFKDWRLPNRFELGSITDNSLITPAIKEPPFANTNSFEYWASSTPYLHPTTGFYTHFSRGTTGIHERTSSHYLRCVRGGL